MSGPADPILAVEGLGKAFGSLRAVDGCSLRVHPRSYVRRLGARRRPARPE